MKHIILLYLLFLTYVCSFSQSASETDFAKKIMESKAFQTQMKEIEKLSKGERTLQLITVSAPNEDKPYFYFKASEDNGLNYVTHIHFKAFLNSERIVIYDPLEDEEIEMK